MALSSSGGDASTTTREEPPMSENPNLIPVQEKHTCGCGGHDEERALIDAGLIPHRFRHAAIIGAASSLGVGEGFNLRAPHVPTPLLAQIDQLPYTFEHTLLDQGEGYAVVEIRRVA